LRPPRLLDASDWSVLRLRDQAYLRSWESGPVRGWSASNSPSAWTRKWAWLAARTRIGRLRPFMITLDGSLAGHIAVNNILYASYRSAAVGCWVATDRAGGGVATAALALVLDHCFGDAGLHRVQAAVRPENLPSRRVLAKAGFREKVCFCATPRWRVIGAITCAALSQSKNSRLEALSPD
jgi:[ribosomal protein S5]-alanine N-acetyltransferase